MLRRSCLGWAVSVLLLAGGSSPGSGQDREAGSNPVPPRNPGEETPFLLEPVVVRAVPPVSVDDVLPVNEVTPVELDRRLYRTTPQALRHIPGVMVQETSHGQGSPYIRGFTGHQNLFLIDGIRLNNSVFRPGPNQYWNTVDPYSIERIEVHKSPNSTRFGTDAIGGTVQAITPNAFPKHGRSFGGELSYRVASAENSHTLRAESAILLTPDTALSGGGTLKHFGDLRAGDGTGLQPNTGYEEADADFKLQHRFHEDGTLTFAYQHVFQDDVPRTHRTVSAKSFAGTTTGSELQRKLDQRRQLAYAQLHRRNISDALDELTVSLSWQRQEESRFRERTGNRLDTQGVTVDTIGLWSVLASETRIGRLDYGFDYYHDEVDSFSSSSTIQGPVADDATYDLFGVFLRDQIDLTDRWWAAAGGRYNYTGVEAGSVRDPGTGTQTSLSDNWHAAVGDLRISYALVPGRLKWFGGVAQGFRAPNLSDLTRFDIARSGEVETAAPGLDPEHFLSFENGFSYQHPRVSASATGFYTRIDDQIVRVPTGASIGGMPEVTKANVGDGWIYGVEVGAAWEFAPQWTLFGNLTWMEGKVDTFPTPAPVIRREYMDRLMPLTGQAGLRWEEERERFWSELMLVAARKADRTSTRDNADTQRIPPGGTPGYTVLHLRAGWNINEHFQLAVAAENLFDKDHRVHGSGQNRPGRNFIASLTAAF